MEIELVSNDLKGELNNIFSHFNSEEIGGIFWVSLKDAAKVTVVTKIFALKNTIKTIFQVTKGFTKYMYEIIKNERFYFWKRLLSDSKALVESKIILIKKIWESMSFEEKKATMIDFTIITLSALVFGGGLDFEGGAPDMDSKFGIGNHRNLFSHTILLGFTLEFGLRFIGNLLINSEKKGIYPRIKLLSSILDFIKKNHEKVIKGMWIGLFVHYLKDANLLSNRTKPYSGLHGLDMQTHQGIYTSNAILSAIFASNVKSEESSK